MTFRVSIYEEVDWISVCCCTTLHIWFPSHTLSGKANIRVFAGEQIAEDNMTSVTSSFELYLKSRFDTTSTVAILALSVVLLVAWKCRKSFKQFIKYGRFKSLPQMCNRKRPPEENEDNYSKVLFSFNLRFLA